MENHIIGQVVDLDLYCTETLPVDVDEYSEPPVDLDQWNEKRDYRELKRAKNYRPQICVYQRGLQRHIINFD